MRINRRQAALAMASLAGTALPVQAQDAARATLATLATYQGADRQQKLIDAAKKEGELSVYHVYPFLPSVLAAFTKKYGIKVKAWRAGSEAVLQRVLAEARGGRHEVDLMQNNAPENEAAYREKLLAEVWSPHLKDLLGAAVPAHAAWAGITIDIWTAAYNTAALRREDLPRSYADLADAKWRGKLAIEANNHAWFGSLLAELGTDSGAKLFAQIVERNGMTTRKGHSALAQAVAAGDVALALTVYQWNPEQLKRKGAPIDAHVLQPLLGQPSTVAIARRAPNPAAALLFYDFVLSEGQKILADAAFVPTTKLLDGPYAKVPLKMIDPARALDLQDKWLKQFDEMFVTRAR